MVLVLVKMFLDQDDSHMNAHLVTIIDIIAAAGLFATVPSPVQLRDHCVDVGDTCQCPTEVNQIPYTFFSIIIIWSVYRITTWVINRERHLFDFVAAWHHIRDIDEIDITNAALSTIPEHVDFLLTENADRHSRWEVQLSDFMQMLGFDVSKYRMKIREKRMRRRVGKRLLQYRDIIFRIRAEVYKVISKESCKTNTHLMRLAVARQVEESFSKEKLASEVRDIIREACVNAVF